MSRIPGPPVCGMNHYFERAPSPTSTPHAYGIDVLGAGPGAGGVKRMQTGRTTSTPDKAGTAGAGAAARAAALAKKIADKAKKAIVDKAGVGPKDKPGDKTGQKVNLKPIKIAKTTKGPMAKHAQTVKSARAAVLKAKRSGVAAVLAGRKYNPKAHKTLVQGGAELIGALTTKKLRSQLNSRQKAAVSRHEASIVKHKKAAVAATRQGLAALKAGKKANDALRRYAAAAVRLKSKPGQTRVRGDDLDRYTVDAEGNIVDSQTGEIMDTDAELDAVLKYYEGDSTGAPADPAVDKEIEGAASTPEKFFPEGGTLEGDMQPIQNWKDVGGIPYKGAAIAPRGLGSAGYLHQTTARSGRGVGEDDDLSGSYNEYGYIYGSPPNDANAPGDKPDWWFKVHGRRYLANWWDTVSDASSLLEIQQRSLAENSPSPWGPIVGNPTMPAYKGLKVSLNDGTLFWLPQDAPASATAEINAAAKLAEDARLKAEKEADEADRKAQEKRDAELAEEKTLQDAINALALSEAQTGDEVSRLQHEAELRQLDIERERFQQDQQRADMEYQNAWLQWAQQNPAAAFGSGGADPYGGMDPYAYGGDFGYAPESGYPPGGYYGAAPVDWGDGMSDPFYGGAGGVDWGDGSMDIYNPYEGLQAAEGGFFDPNAIDWGIPYDEQMESEGAW